ncbi:RNA polymerase sigma factor [Alteromonas sp. H39]|uniref:RNA polymerase sigma factor n=1 Tax=Alteromonas sp. H39 TaxID=3389876 RepID=UPI0039E11154
MQRKFEDLFREYGALLSRVASSYEANDALQQELLQEIAVAVWQAMARFQGNSSVKTYILKVAHNRAVSHVASQVRLPATEEYMDEMSPASERMWSPEKAVEQDKALTRLLRVVRELPLPGRQVLTLSLEGLSYDEIADVCGLTTNHVGVLLKRAKAAINRSFEHDDA